MISPSSSLQGLVHARQPGEELIAGIAEFLVRLGDGRRGVGIELEFPVLGGEECQAIADRVGELGAVLDRLALLGVLLGGLLLARVVGLRRPRPCRWRSSLLAVSRAASNRVAILRLAAANSALALASPVDRGVDDRPPLLLVGGHGLALESLEFFAERLASLGVFGVGRAVARDPVAVNLRLDLGALGHQREDLPQDGALALEELGLGWPPGALGLASDSGGGRKPVVEVVTMAHSGRNNRGGPGRAPRRSSACR